MKKIAALIPCCLIGWIGMAQPAKYTDGKNSWNADSLGNHRALVIFNGAGKIAKINLPWRRRDERPAEKRILVQDAATGQKIQNVKTGKINNETGEIYFEPVSGKGEYFIYYLPSKNEGRSNYPHGIYLKPENTASPGWLQTIDDRMVPNTSTKEIQSIDGFNSFYPMEVIATAKETSRLISKSNRKDMLIFPEDRLYPIKMKDRLPQRWVDRVSGSRFTGTAARGEYYTWQIGLYALQQLEAVKPEFSDLKDGKGHVIEHKYSSCINTSGIDYRGTSFSKTLTIEKNRVQALWCSIDIPPETTPGEYQGEVIIRSSNSKPFRIALQMKVTGATIADGGISEPEKQTRLKWLNSTLYQENEVISPYTPLQLQNQTIRLLGRTVELKTDGFPGQVQTYFSREMTDYTTVPHSLLAAPIHFNFIKQEDGKLLDWENQGLRFTKQTPGTIQWEAVNSNENFRMDVHASLEFDGFIAYTVQLTANRDATYRDISLQLPLTRESAVYLMGLGQKGGYRPAAFEWKWDVASKNQDGAWIGTVNAGIQFSLRDEKYSRPLNTNFYLQKPLLLPGSWGNENKGGIKITERNDTVLVNNYSGERHVKKGDLLYYNFTLLITPFHTINTDFQWQNRFYHQYNAIDSIRATGATLINIHHATPVNPWINYPFIEYKKLKAYIDEAHSKGLKVKIYNTVREVSNRAYETPVLRSLGHEIYSPGKGGGFSWLQEHLGDDYIAAWFVPEIKDAAIVNSGMSRWHNYYVEGMNWLVQHTGIDGIYLDDVAFDRITMKRIKRALTQNQHPGIIDLHSANQYNKSDGFNNSANLYMEHFPYLNRLWFGEYYDYNKNPPDFFLTEISGIPFGLMGEMLQDGGNAWRGMVYGMTNRMPWSDDADPRPLWKIWDEFGMQGTKMVGYWSDQCPVKTNHEKVLATIFKKEKAALVAVASWAEDSTRVRLEFDWNKLGINPAKASFVLPEIKNFQPGGNYQAGDDILVGKGKGFLMVIREKQ